MLDVFRYDRAADEADPTLHVRLSEWVRTLGLNPGELLPEAVVLKGDNSYELHLSRVRRKADGSEWVDWAQQSVVTEPLIVDLGQDTSWPKPRTRMGEA